MVEYFDHMDLICCKYLGEWYEQDWVFNKDKSLEMLKIIRNNHLLLIDNKVSWEGGWGEGSMIKFLLGKHKELSSNPLYHITARAKTPALNG